MNFPEIQEKDRSFHTWAKGNPYLAKTLPKPPPLLKPGEKFIDTETELRYDRPEDDPHHPDYHSTTDIPMHELIHPDDPCRDFYVPWSQAYEPVLTFYRDAPSLNPVDHLRERKVVKRTTSAKLDLPLRTDVKVGKRRPTTVTGDPVWKTRSRKKK